MNYTAGFFPRSQRVNCRTFIFLLFFFFHCVTVHAVLRDGLRRSDQSTFIITYPSHPVILSRNLLIVAEELKQPQLNFDFS